jgi:prepilin-type N-terminal cleavage/methylation domain-containing protein
MAAGKGFTLIEMMVVLTIIGILATLAIPGYRTQVAQAHQTQAAACLVETAAAIHRQALAGASRGDWTLPRPAGGCIERLSPVYAFAIGAIDTSSGESNWGDHVPMPEPWRIRAWRRDGMAASRNRLCQGLVYRHDGLRRVIAATGEVRNPTGQARQCWQ